MPSNIQPSQATINAAQSEARDGVSADETPLMGFPDMPAILSTGRAARLKASLILNPCRRHKRGAGKKGPSTGAARPEAALERRLFCA
jgi:hypothetical protein